MFDCLIDLNMQGANEMKSCLFVQAKGKLFAHGVRSQAAMSSIAGLDKVSILSQSITLGIYFARLYFGH
jgi:hypothetical protein